MRQRIIFILATSLFAFLASAQSLEQTKVIANEAFARGDYNLALNSYQRVLYFEKGKVSPEVFYSIGESHYQKGNYEKALVYFDRAYYAAEKDSLQYLAVFGKIRTLLQQREWDLALSEIYGEEDYVSPEDRVRMEFFKGICFFAKEDFSSSEDAFLNVLHEKDTLKQKSIVALFDDESRLHRPQPKTAQILSYIVPGLGQMYAGDVEKSINSLFLNAGLVALFIHTGWTYSIIDATISVVPWFQRYYLGGAKKAGMIAGTKLKENRKEVLSEVFVILNSH